jgi:hypothetical protein
MKLSHKDSIFITLVLLFLLVSLSYPGDLIHVTDLYDYSDTARIFAGDYKAKERSSHSILYGFLLSPLVKLTGNFLLIKFMSLLWLFILILIIYYKSGKKRKSLFLMLLSPLVWYMSPWLSPLPLVYLLFTLSYLFIDKFNKDGTYRNLIYSALLLGLASSLWDPALYFSIIFLFSFFYDHKLHLSISFLFFIFIGIIPKLILDAVVFNFAFYGIIKHFLSTLSFGFFKGIYGEYTSTFLATILTFLFIPVYSFCFYKKEVFLKFKKPILFITFSWIFVLLTNSQPRLIFLPIPIALLTLGKILNNKQFKIQIAIFSIISLLVIIPYMVQITYDINLPFVSDHSLKISNYKITKERLNINLKEDLIKIGEEYPSETFLVGNLPDDYKKFAHFYWGSKIKEFVSVQDYNLYTNNDSIIASKRLETNPPQNIRRSFWMEVGLEKNKNDKTDYSKINYALSLEDSLIIDNFELIKKYKSVSLYKKFTPAHI